MRFATGGRFPGVGLVALVTLGGLGSSLAPRGLAQDPPRAGGAKLEATNRLPGRYTHVALYTFKADAPKGTAAAFQEEAERCFGLIPEVRGFRVGPAAGQATPRAFTVDTRTDYHVGVVLSFDGFGGLARYGNHPRHNELKQKYARFFEKIVVYDFEG